MTGSKGTAVTFAEHMVMQGFIVFNPQTGQVLAQTFLVIAAGVDKVFITTDAFHLHRGGHTRLHHIGWFFEIIVTFGVASGTKAVLV